MAKKNSENNNGAHVLDMADILARPVVSAPQAAEFFEPDPEQNIEQAENAAVFAEEPEVITQEDDPHATADDGFMPAKDIAELLVNLVDGFQSSTLPVLLERKMFTEKERDALQDMDLSGGTVYTPETGPQAMLLKKWKYYKGQVEKVPFSTGESRRLINATERYAKTVDLKVTPLQGLLMAFSEVTVKRAKIFFTS